MSNTRVHTTDKRSSRDYDHNGWAEIKENPITKVGVFQYSGRQIADENNSQNLDLDKLYNVYRPAEELSKPETIDSFKLLPWVDEHAMLGAAEDGKTPAEQHGVQGVIGEDVRFDPKTNYLVANLKIFSDSMSKSIDVDEKKEISAGYYCDFIKESGVYDGENYDFVPRNIRGNHIALVWEGRSGPDVSVLDSMKFTFDAKELQIMPEIELKEKIALDADEKLDDEKTEAKDAEGEYKKFLNKADAEDEDEDEEEKKAMDEDDDVDPEAMDEDEKKDKAMDSVKSASMDEKAFYVRMSERNELAEKLSNHIGTFDHASKTLDEVAKYGIQKLKLNAKCPRGQENTFLAGYLEGAKVKSVATAQFSGDSKIESGCIDKWLKDKE
jgi:hypothetical protein